MDGAVDDPRRCGIQLRRRQAEQGVDPESASPGLDRGQDKVSFREQGTE